MKRNAFFSADSQKRKDVFKIVSGYKWGKDTAYKEDVIFYLDKKKINDVAVDDIKNL